MTDNYGADVAMEKDRIEGTWSINGEEYSLLTEDVEKQTLNLVEEYARLAQQFAEDELPENAGEDLDNFPWETEESDKDMVESILEAKLIKPDINVQEAPMRKLSALLDGMMEAWQEGKTVKQSKAEMPLDEGNR